MLIVADSSALVALATCQALHLLSKLFEEIIVPRAVFNEVSIPDKPQANSLTPFPADRVMEFIRLALFWELAAWVGAR